ncbi:2-oxoisovalerate dehydrogenase subunit alpha [Lysinibacillus sphaericus]|nr:2-oxoisovalerate dehydrogenase subunit alpha [Lysinibacillus sphaericus]
MATNRHEELGLTNDDVLQIYETMLMARKIGF